MKPDWDKLIAEYRDHESVLVVDVDCTSSGGKALCSDHGVKGYPTIKFGDPNDLSDYDGGRTFKDLSAFAKENLGPRCSPANLDLCDEAKTKQIDEFIKMGEAALTEKITEEEAKMKKIDDDQQLLLKSLQARFEKSVKESGQKKKNIKESGLGLMKSVAAHKKSTKSEILDL